jgi:hypothetical protein
MGVEARSWYRRWTFGYAPSMLWALLALLGIPIWFIAIALGVLVYRNRALHSRPDDIPCRLQNKPGGRWSRGHALWIHDVFSFRASPASWNDYLGWVRQVSLRSPNPDEARKLRRFPDPIIAMLLMDDGTTIAVAAGSERQTALTGPIAPVAFID